MVELRCSPCLGWVLQGSLASFFHAALQSQSWLAAPLCCTPSCLHPAATLSQFTGEPGQGGGWNPASPITQETET